MHDYTSCRDVPHCSASTSAGRLRDDSLSRRGQQPKASRRPVRAADCQQRMQPAGRKPWATYPAHRWKSSRALRFGSFHARQSDCEFGSETRSSAFGVDAAAMQFNEALGDVQTQPDAASTLFGCSCLLEPLENERQQCGFDAFTAVRHVDEGVRGLPAGSNAHLPPFRREFDRRSSTG